MSIPKKKKKTFLALSAIALGAFVISILFLFLKPLQPLEYRYTDKLFEWRGPLDVSDSPIVLVAISDQADEEIPEKYPWPTSIYARLVENLNKAGAKVILFDVVFNNPDKDELRNDTLFAQALNKYGNVILGGDLRLMENQFSQGLTQVFPTEVLQDNNPNRVGFVHVNLASDGAVRNYRFGTEYQEEDYYMLGLEGIRLFDEIPYEEIAPLSQDSTHVFKLGAYSIQKDGNYEKEAWKSSFIINYYGPDGTFPEVSLEEVIDDSSYTTNFERELEYGINTFDDPEIGLLQRGVFKDKIVIIGATMPLLKDFYATPFANAGKEPRPGYQVHANAIQTVLDSNYITRFGGYPTIFIMFVMCLSIALVNGRWSANWGIFYSLIAAGVYFGITVWAFVNQQVLMQIVGPVAAIILTQVGMVSYQYYTELKEKKRIRGMFSSYVSPELVDQMIESGKEPSLGGEETYMTAFFSDIVSFSTFSEQLEAKELVKLINEYLNSMTGIVNDRGGTLDKYIGDAIVAFFGAPVPVKDHALQACMSSQLMQKELARLRQKWGKDGWPDIVINMQHRMGMNTGNMVTGNMGSERRFNYTMMGDNVNLAARCESGAKQYGVFTMVTEATKKEAEKFGDECVFRFLDQIVVKGRTQPARVYEIAGLREDAYQELFDCIGLYEEGMEHYLNQEWDKAIAKFEASARLEEYEQNPSGIFINRCKQMKQNPPGPDWNGVYVMQSK
ncbi:CHASE2 domain-containing protein [Gracilimonas mengyeensis]|uniref:Sensor domain CHASE2-containing protein n=1 Tax=Gracilimonas mengyeensis TaxID=1302730 RepID=A0A521FCK5_9BACT|nr:adenylate/guanylate cyclase domain-containing protein [Gracilimonas mengyeensis]SMO93331.1 sensor domain CHASE2-containing protein [Gracilimonas mengyeensis]